MEKKAWLLVILVILGLTACATTQGVVKEPPLPNDVNIIPPSSNLQKIKQLFRENGQEPGLQARIVCLWLKKYMTTGLKLFGQGQMLLGNNQMVMLE
jgi:hypothetical protein